MPHPLTYEERQDWIDQHEAWRSTLPPAPIPHFLTGLKLRAPDSRDYDLRDLPGVSDALRAGLPETADLVRHFKGPVLNQGAIPSCVAHTLAHMQAIHQSIEEGGVARVFDAPLVHRATGPENQGRWPDDLLRYCKDHGMPLVGSGQRYRISAYAFAPKTSPQVWVDSIKAAIVAERPVPICFLLPTNFSAESSGTPTQGYHEVTGVGFRPNPVPYGSLLLLNSWSEQWGNRGYGWVSFQYLLDNSWQNGYVIAHSGVMDERTNPQPEPQPEPQPQPQPQPEPQPQPNPQSKTVFGIGRGFGLEMLVAGQSYALTGNGFNGTLKVDSAKWDEVQPNPQPQPEPEPEPQPQPEPTPGDLEVKPQLYRARGGWNLFVYVKGGDGQGAAEVVVTSNGAIVWTVRRQATLDGRNPATAAVRQAPPGAWLKCVATAGPLRGEATIAVPAAADGLLMELPPLVDEQ